MTIGAGRTDSLLTEEEARELLQQCFETAALDGKRLLVIIPDGTRSGPVPLFFRLFHELLGDKVAALDYLIALGTHQPMSEEAIQQRLGVSAEEMATRYANVHVFNHHWEQAETFATLGIIPAEEIKELSGGRFAQPVNVALNRMIFDYDQLLVCGPVFPHEVAGYSGGNKYFFPGISGSEVIDFTHWLGALITSYEIIGTKYTPVRAVIDRAAAMIPVPKMACCFVVKDGGLAGLYIGTPEDAWSAAADLSSQLHVRYLERPFQRVLAVMPEMYDDIWTAAKGMYKLEPVIADGGELIIYAPHISEFSYTHGPVIEEIGYHVRDYFVKQWERFQDYPHGVLAHSTHLRGNGEYDETGERPRVTVTLATGISPERCAAANLGYCDPSTIDVASWLAREEEGVLVVPHAGEVLFRLIPSKGEHVDDPA